MSQAASECTECHRLARRPEAPARRASPWSWPGACRPNRARARWIEPSKSSSRPRVRVPHGGLQVCNVCPAHQALTDEHRCDLEAPGLVLDRLAARYADLLGLPTHSRVLGDDALAAPVSPPPVHGALQQIQRNPTVRGSAATVANDCGPTITKRYHNPMNHHTAPPDATVYRFCRAPRHGPACAQGQRSPRLNAIPSNGGMLTGSSSFALAMSTHWPSRSSNASRVRSVGSTSQRCPTPSRA